MNGMELMLKSLGFDPSEFQNFLGGLKDAVGKINSDLEMIKSVQLQLLEKQIQLADSITGYSGVTINARSNSGSKAKSTGNEARSDAGSETGSETGSE